MSDSQMIDFQTYLQSELLRRKKLNSKYSLRAFARDLDVEVSSLSKIMRGKRKVSHALFGQMTARLGVSDSDIITLNQGEFFGLGQATPTYANISDEVAEVMADWLHFAILELTRVRFFEGNLNWIALTLGEPVYKVKWAVERLQKTGYLLIKEDGTWVDSSEYITSIVPNLTSQTKMRVQSEILERAIRSIHQIPLQDRDNTSVTMAIDLSKLAEARALIKKFRRQLCKLLTEQPNHDEVYQLGIALYPLTQVSRRKKAQ